MRHRDRVQWSFQLLLPERQETLQFGEVRAEIVVLPDIALQQPGMIRAPVEDMGGSQPVAGDLLLKVDRHHRALQPSCCPPHFLVRAIHCKPKC